MMNRKISKEELYKLYWEKEYSFKEIAEMFDCAPITILTKFKKFGIKSRTLKESMNTKKYRTMVTGENNHMYGRTDDNHPNWKGGIMHAAGYIFIKKPNHPRARKDGYVKRAHLVAEEMLGRYLYPDEITHHKNGIKDDDQPENIQIMKSNAAHLEYHRLKKSRMRA